MCNSCGGEIVCDENTAATSCPYCGNPVVMMGQVSGALKPDYVIPFKIDKKAAKEDVYKRQGKNRVLKNDGKPYVFSPYKLCLLYTSFSSGVFYYFLTEQVKALVQQMADAFPDSVLVFDAANRTAVKDVYKRQEQSSSASYPLFL